MTETTTAQAKTFPRIWDWSGERTIVGETSRSWLVGSRIGGSDEQKISKNCANWSGKWFWSEQEWDDATYQHRHAYEIGRQIQRDAKLSAATLRKVAELIGYKGEERK